MPIGILLLTSLTALPGCINSHLDKKIEELRNDIAIARSELSTYANPYRVSNFDFKVDVSPKPLLGFLDRFNELSDSDRRMKFHSIATEGYITRWWTRCPWPGEAEIQLRLIDLHPPPTFFGFIGVDPIRYHPWDAVNGLTFDTRVFGLAGAGIYAYVDTCVWKGPIPIPGLVAAFLDPSEKSGHSEFSPVPNEGIRYQVRLYDKPLLIGVISFAGLGFVLPFRLSEEIASGVLKNVVGKEGQVEVPAINFKRKYEISILFDHASVLPGGVRAGGPIVITWK